MDKYVEANGLRLHYLDYGGSGEPVLFLHGLTANAHFFDGLIAAGLNDHLRVLALDLRGRGLSDKPEQGYSMEDHARDVAGMLDALGFEQITLGGHSFGGLLTIYLGAKYPARVKKMVIIDAGILHPSVRDLIKPSLERLGKPVPSWDTYLAAIKGSPYYHDGFWDEHLEAYYRADVETLADGAVKARALPGGIAQAVDAVLGEDWTAHMPHARQPAILLHAPDGFGPPGTPPVLTVEGAQTTAHALGNCRYQQMTGHHITTFFGEHAPKMVRAITAFVGEG